MTGPGRRSLRRARSRVAELGLALVLCGLAGGAGAATRLTEVRVLDGPDATSLELTLEGPTPEVRSFVRDDRLVVELPWVLDGTGRQTIAVDGARASHVEVVPHRRRLDLVVFPGDAVAPFEGRGIAPTEDGLRVIVGTGSVATDAAVVAAAPGVALPLSTVAAAQAAAPSAGEPASQVPVTALTRVEVLDAHHATALQLHMDGAVPEAQTSVRDGPLRMVIELPGVVDRTGTPTLELAGVRAASVEVVPREGSTLIVILAGDVEDPFQGRSVARTDVGLLVTIGTGPAVAKEGAAVAGAAAAAGAAATAAAAGGSESGAATGAAAGAAPTASVPDTAADEGGPLPLRADGERFIVTRFTVEYGAPHPDLPPVEEILRIEVDLGLTAHGYVAPREGVPTEHLRLLDTRNAPIQVFYGSAIRTIDEAIVAEFNRRGLAGVLVIPHEEDVDPQASRDLRPPDRTTLRIVVWTGRLIEFRTFASGDRVAEDGLVEDPRIDNPIHARIKERSPVQPGDLLDKEALDEYTALLSRHPGRSVDTALSAAREPGGVYLDFLVAENKPWSGYAQFSNTGTDETADWRQRFGFVHNQVTGRDDIARIDYITGDFDEVQAVFSSYEAVLGPFDWLRWNLGGSYTEYDASEFGFVNSKFTGEQWDVNGQLVANVFQWRELFVDIVTGARFQQVETTNKPHPDFKTTGQTEFFFAEVGMRLERVTEASALRGFVSAEFNIPGIADTKKKELLRMGRTGVKDDSFEILRWDLMWSFFLEPVLFPEEYEDPSTPESSTLAHELLFSTRGQTTFNTRVIPQFEGVAGGLYSVRGYNQSTVSGDTLVLGRGEYRLHLPRLFPIQPLPYQVPVIGEFRAAPRQVYGLPDWDLILRAFADIGRTTTARTVPGESNETLFGVGLGAELRVLDNLVLSFDWGHRLKTVRKNQPNTQSSGRDEFHFSGTVIY